MKTIKEILDVLDEIGTEFPSNVHMKIEFSDIESEDDIRKLAKQENANLFEPCQLVPYLWIDWHITKQLNVSIRCKKKNYVLG
jgi:uncharacterized protein involved in high-affinity Fe2+ transport